MFGLGPWELAVTVGVILVIAGPTLLPRLGRTLGKSIKELKESTESFSTNLREEMERDEEERPPQLPEGTASEGATDDKASKQRPEDNAA